METSFPIPLASTSATPAVASTPVIPAPSGEVFLVGASGLVSLASHYCRNEDAELQRLLVENPNLLPSRQIDPEDPPRWLLIQEEMPVPDPTNGIDRWSLDVLFVDHLAIPTFVECKRMQDTRSRREVVAQMIEYAANGHHYWDAADLRARAEKAQGSAEALQAWISAHTNAADTEAFFQQVQANLRDAKIRLIFFLEEAPSSLPSLVDFLNKQLNATEVLLVEARQYRVGGASGAGSETGLSQDQRILVPRVFGYTEQARVAKRASRQEVVNALGGASAGGEEAFINALAQAALPEATRTAMQALLDAWQHTAVNDQPYWKFLKTANLVLPKLHPSRALIGLDKSGRLGFNFGNWNPERYTECPPLMETAFAQFLQLLEERCGWRFTPEQQMAYPTLKPGLWESQTANLVEVINSL